MPRLTDDELKAIRERCQRWSPKVLTVNSGLHDELVEGYQDVQALLDEVVALRQLLADIEWVPGGAGLFCPDCQNARTVKHAADCRLAAVLGH